MAKRKRLPTDTNQKAKAIVDLVTDQPKPTPSDEIRAAAAALGRAGGLKGGPARAKALTAKKRSEIAKKGYIPRWTNVKKIAFVLKQKKRALTARQVYEVIINELEYTEWKDKTQKEKASFYGTISSTLVNNSKPGKEFVKSQNEIDENIYSLKN